MDHRRIDNNIINYIILFMNPTEAAKWNSATLFPRTKWELWGEKKEKLKILFNRTDGG